MDWFLFCVIGTASIRASPSCWVVYCSYAQHVKKHRKNGLTRKVGMQELPVQRATTLMSNMLARVILRGRCDGPHRHVLRDGGDRTKQAREVRGACPNDEASEAVGRVWSASVGRGGFREARRKPTQTRRLGETSGSRVGVGGRPARTILPFLGNRRTGDGSLDGASSVQGVGVGLRLVNRRLLRGEA